MNKQFDMKITYTDKNTEWMGEFAWLNYSIIIAYNLYLMLFSTWAWYNNFAVALAIWVALSGEEMNTPYWEFDNNQLLYSLLVWSYMPMNVLLVVIGVLAAVYYTLPYSEAPWFWEQYTS